ncbi:MAG: lipopolysaccharide biosynthesis protein [Chitinophagaceae bacterium]|nr:lipopolysaccharide biosynthesis protein [Chitinophagaceae bacterium]
MQSLIQKFTLLLGPSFGYLLKRWYWIVLSGILVGILAILLAWFAKPNYTSRLTFSVDEDNGIANNFGSLAASFGLDLGSPGGVFAGENIIELVKSRRIIEGALLTASEHNGKQLPLVEYYLQQSPEEGKKKRPVYTLQQSRNTYSREQDSLLGVIYKGLAEGGLYVGKIDKKLSIIEIQVTAGNEKFSKEFTENLMAEISRFYVDSKTSRSRNNVALLQKKADSIRTVLYGSIAARAAIMDANMNPTFQAPMAGVQRKQTDMAVLTAAYGEILKNLEGAKYALAKETPLVQIIDVPIYPLKKKKPSRLIYGLAGGIIGSLCALFFFYFSLLLSTQGATEKKQLVEL